MSLELVAAVAANGVIGREGGLPWNLPDDLKRFKAITMGGTIIMGRNTYDSIGRALPGRRNVVITSRRLEATGVETVASVEDALRMVSSDAGFVIGGGVLYAATLPLVTKMHLTEVEADVDGDAFFPKWDRSQWRLTEETPHEKDERHAYRFVFRTYERV